MNEIAIFLQCKFFTLSALIVPQNLFMRMKREKEHNNSFILGQLNFANKFILQICFSKYENKFSLHVLFGRIFVNKIIF